DTTLESLRANPVTSDLDAGRKKRVVVVPANLVNRAGPRVGQGLAARARARPPRAPFRGGASVDAVTIDAFGTLVELENPVGRLQAALAERGVERGGTPVAGVCVVCAR